MIFDSTTPTIIVRRNSWSLSDCLKLTSLLRQAPPAYAAEFWSYVPSAQAINSTYWSYVRSLASYGTPAC